ncbi:MAG: dephospho-CoA kinase [Clostridia bacterium]|nr:dephospho-CoA kinase [Clostridia bacterium]MBQ7296614.1 dephospho-CoA kinase [Clostridia bacterium]
MLTIGLTGKTGAGKSTVALYLKEKGCYIIDGDVIARQITEKGSDTLPQLQASFGEDILDENGELIRKRLAERAFASPQKTALLNSITHPAIKKRCEAEIEKAKKEGYTVSVIDAAALLESNCKELCEKFVVVSAPEEIRLERILSRDGITHEQATTRIKAQKDDEYYFSQADIIIRNYPPYDKDDNRYKELEELIG